MDNNGIPDIFDAGVGQKEESKCDECLCSEVECDSYLYEYGVKPCENT
jgi:hypothetical protein